MFKLFSANLSQEPVSVAATLTLSEVYHATKKTTNNSTNSHFFETMSKRRRGFPSETQVKRGERVDHGDKVLEEKLGRNDLCPCGSGQRFKKCCLMKGCF
ncbi:MAG: SEC-C metal-binding domain-containing protein [Planctomycetaceae bacterium]